MIAFRLPNKAEGHSPVMPADARDARRIANIPPNIPPPPATEPLLGEAAERTTFLTYVH